MVQQIFTLCFKACRRSFAIFSQVINAFVCKIIFYGQGIKYQSFYTIGLPYISIARGGTCTIGDKFKMNNTLAGNPIGRSQPCVLFVDTGAKLSIGNHVGISQAALVCHYSIEIRDYVKIGGGVCIYDTDFHSLDPIIRKNPELDFKNKQKAAVLIKENAFIGAHSTILKGVTIGENSVIGACSLVVKDVPDNEIWAGNPAKFIRSI